MVTRIITNGNAESFFSPLAVVKGENMDVQFASQPVKNVHALKIIALDEKGEEIHSFTSQKLDVSLIINASETSKIDSVHTVCGSVSLIGFGHVDNISTTSGDISVEKIEGNVRNVSSTSGDLHIRANNVINASSISGNIIKK